MVASILLVFTALLFLSPATTGAQPPSEWHPGDEYEIFGHYFSEEYWTNDSIFVETESGYNIQFIMSYVNYTADVGSFQAALLALGLIEDNETSALSTLPYQLFGLHFTTPSNKEIFVGAILAFLYAYNDTNGNHVPNSGEDFWYVIPYGTSEGNESRIPTVDAVNATKLGPGHYQFGVTYRNLYAKIIEGGSNLLAFLLSLAFPIFVAKFSEFTVIYDIEVDTDTGEITAETFYRIGQIEELYIAGEKVDPHETLKLVGVGAAHYVVIFTSQYWVHKGSTTPVPAADWIMANITTDRFGQERAFAIGTRGTYDLINESTDPWTTINSSLPAYSWILEPKLTDLILIAWQLPFSAYLFSVFAYAMSSYLQVMYHGPLDLFNHADTAFKTTDLWYGIAFPWYEGYRIEHDPVYTAYSNIGQETTPPAPIPGFPWEAMVIALSSALILVLVVRHRKRTKLASQSS